MPGCDDKVTVGDDLDVQIKDIGAWTAGAAVAYGDELAVGAGGKAVKATAKSFIVGIALEEATKAGQRIAVQIVKSRLQASRIINRRNKKTMSRNVMSTNAGIAAEIAKGWKPKPVPD